MLDYGALSQFVGCIDKDLDPKSNEAAEAYEIWFREQVSMGLKEAVETPELCIPLHDIEARIFVDPTI